MGECVGLFLVDLNNHYQERLKADALTKGEALGFRIDVQLADGDPARQSAQIMAAIENRGASGMTALLVCPVKEDTLANAARAALAAGLDFVLLNRRVSYLDALRREFPKRLAFSVLPDQAEIGRIQGRQARILAPSGTQVVCVTGRPDTWSARERLAGLKEIVGTSHPIAAVNGNWNTVEAQRAVASWLEANRLTRPVGIFVAHNDDMALGARQAAVEGATRWSLPMLSQAPIVGCDGSYGFGQRLVLARRLAATIVVSSAAGPALTCLHGARSGGALPAAQVVLSVSSFPELDELIQTVRGSAGSAQL